jgi:hypothetical protein
MWPMRQIGTSCDSELPECVEEVDVGTGGALGAGDEAPALILSGGLGQSGARRLDCELAELIQELSESLPLWT